MKNNHKKSVPASLPGGRYFFSGNEAVAEGAISAGCRFFGGYPITPSSEIMERIAARFPETGGVFTSMACVSTSEAALWPR
jgi:2-oxoglutarate ferredoxin oxidoreductase subunit alpha